MNDTCRHDSNKQKYKMKALQLKMRHDETNKNRNMLVKLEGNIFLILQVLR